SGAHMQSAIWTRTGRDPGVKADRRRHHETVVIVRMFADQVDTAGSTEDRRTRAIRAFKFVAQQLRRRFVAGWRARHSQLFGRLGRVTPEPQRLANPTKSRSILAGDGGA